MSVYVITFRFQPHEWLEVTPGNIIREKRERVTGRTWEHAVLQAAASVPAPLAPATLRSLLREDYEVRED